MRVAVFSTKPYDREFLAAANAAAGHDLALLEPRLSVETAALAQGADAVCAFVNDDLATPAAVERDGATGVTGRARVC